MSACGSPFLQHCTVELPQVQIVPNPGEGADIDELAHAVIRALGHHLCV